MATEFDPKEASGESAMRGSRPLDLNEVSLNGDGGAKEVATGKWERQGGYFRKRILVGKPKDAKPEEVDLGARIEVVFLKVRRRLVERGEKGKIIRSTSEHNHKNETVSLYETESKERINGVAADLRERFDGLRTVQIVYALLMKDSSEPELVRLVVKGSSLGSDVKAPDVPTFYGYISAFTGEDHFYQYKTVLTPVLEEGAKPYYAINFQRGDRLSDVQYSYALEKMREVHENCIDVDMQRAKRVISETTIDDEVPIEEPSDVPADGPNPDDIPW